MLIELKNVSKRFNKILALDDVSFNINEGEIFGLAGPNGSGKSSLLRLLGGIYYQDTGKINLDHEPIFENPKAKENIFLVSDSPYFFSNYNIDMIAKFYSNLYSGWNFEIYNNLYNIFPIDRNVKTINMSKGMRKQSSFVLAMSCGAKYILLDEIFDGIDPIVRVILKQVIIESVTELKKSFLVASHNLKELEDICDHIGLLNKGKMALQEDIDNIKLSMYKVQLSLKEGKLEENIKGLDIITREDQGRVTNLLVKGKKEDILDTISKLNPIFLDVIPLTLEEIFIGEMEALGYDFKD
mgnify:CR=1 FL=1